MSDTRHRRPGGADRQWPGAYGLFRALWWIKDWVVDGACNDCFAEILLKSLLIGAFWPDSLDLRVEGIAMMGPRQVAQGALFYEFSIEAFVPQDHPMRGIDRFLDLTDVWPLLAHITAHLVARRLIPN